MTREPGVCALTAGPGVTNGISAMASAQANHSPIVVLGGRAPALRWGQGSLQEIDHVPFVRPLAKLAATPESTEEIPGLSMTPSRRRRRRTVGPAFVDFPLDYVFMEAAEGEPGEPGERGGEGEEGEGAEASAGETQPRAARAALDRAAELLAGAERPV